MKILYILLIATFLFSCSPKRDAKTADGKDANAWVNGEIKDADENMTVKLMAQTQFGDTTIGEATIDKDGKFAMSLAIKGLGIYQLKFGDRDDKALIFPLNVKDELVIKGNFSNIEVNPTYSGTKWSDNANKFYGHYKDFANVQGSVINDQTLTDEQKIEKLLKLRQPLEDFIKKVISEDPGNEANLLYSNLLSPVAGYQYWDHANLEILKKMADAYISKYPDAPFGQSIKNQCDFMEQGYTEYLDYQKNGGQATSGMSNEKAPEIALPNPDGKVMKLSSLKGKYVLLDFWASWCPPCRRENPNIVAAYQKYNKKGFEIFSVSLDKDVNAWKSAIQKDNLMWKYHVSDLKEWESSVIPLYGIESIPHSLLLDPNGNVIATNLRGDKLEQKLNEIFNK